MDQENNEIENKHKIERINKESKVGSLVSPYNKTDKLLARLIQKPRQHKLQKKEMKRGGRRHLLQILQVLKKEKIKVVRGH